MIRTRKGSVRVVADDLHVCDCCLIWIANRDDSGCTDSDDHPHKLATFPRIQPILDQDPTACIVAVGTDPITFSRLSCDSCGSPYHGTRHEVAILSSTPRLWD